jgi:glycosyltransferase involved in cell wall biosynthesis
LIVISNGGAWPPSDAIVACLEANIPYITIAHSNSEEWFPTSDEAALIRLFFEAAKGCWFVSEQNKKLTERQIGQFLPHALIVRNPFSVPYSVRIPWPVTSEKENVNFACVARLHAASKGHDILFEVLSTKLWKGRNWTLSLFGDGPQRETYERLIKQCSIEDRVHFRGHVSDIVQIWREHHIHLIASRYEGLPIASVDAMLCGRVVVATDVGGNAEIIEDGLSGFLSRAPTASLVGEALERAWAVRDEWRVYGERASQHIRVVIPEDPVKEAIMHLEAAIGGRSFSQLKLPKNNVMQDMPN